MLPCDVPVVEYLFVHTLNKLQYRNVLHNHLLKIHIYHLEYHEKTHLFEKCWYIWYWSYSLFIYSGSHGFAAQGEIISLLALNLILTCIFYISQNTLRSVGQLAFVVTGFEFSFTFNINWTYTLTSVLRHVILVVSIKPTNVNKHVVSIEFRTNLSK